MRTAIVSGIIQKTSTGEVAAKEGIRDRPQLKFININHISLITATSSRQLEIREFLRLPQSCGYLIQTLVSGLAKFLILPAKVSAFTCKLTVEVLTRSLDRTI